MMFDKYLHQLWHLLNPYKDCSRSTVITNAGLQRQMLYDAFGEPEEVAELVGLPPISEEGMDAERKAARARAEAIVAVAPLLVHQAQFMAFACATAQLNEADEEPDPVQQEALHRAFNNICLGAVMAAVASAVDLGVLVVNKEVFVDAD